MINRISSKNLVFVSQSYYNLTRAYLISNIGYVAMIIFATIKSRSCEIEKKNLSPNMTIQSINLDYQIKKWDNIITITSLAMLTSFLIEAGGIWFKLRK